MNTIPLKYGLNPHQSPALLRCPGAESPLMVLNGKPGYINLMDALNAWQLVSELSESLQLPAAASFKHVSPAGVGLGLPLNDKLKAAYRVQDDALSPLACAYARARGADRMSSFGDFIALSEPCDVETALLIKREVSDGVIAPGYVPEALDILKSKRGGGYLVLAMDPAYRPQGDEKRTVFGFELQQPRNDMVIHAGALTDIRSVNRTMRPDKARDLLLCLHVLKYTQSNSVCLAFEGQTVGVGAGQQSRIHCTRLACDKADRWFLRQHDKALSLPFLPALKGPDKDNAIDVYLSDEADDVLSDESWPRYFTHKPEPLTAEEKTEYLKTIKGVCMGSDAFFPFADNIRRAARSGVGFVAEPGGSIRDDEVIAACDERDMVLVFTGYRLFHH